MFRHERGQVGRSKEGVACICPDGLTACCSETVGALRLMASTATFAEGLAAMKLIPVKINQMAKFWEQANEGTTVLRAAKWAQRFSSVVEKLGVALDLVSKHDRSSAASIVHSSELTPTLDPDHLCCH